MIISLRHRYIFVHIPKTGGTSLSAALGTRAGPDDILIGDTPKARRRVHRLKALKAPGRLWKHSRLSDIEGLPEATPLSDFFIVTLTRDPWERVLSLYHWLRAQTFAHPAVPLAKALDFPAFLADKTIAAMLAADTISAYVGDRADTVIRLEHLKTDAAPFEAHLGFPLPPVPHLNPSDRPSNARAAYDAAGAARVADWYAEDIVRFGYSF
jgi:hypothetical protein